MTSNISLSLIIPIYNRPQEAQEMLESLSLQSDLDFEVLIIEDGSTVPCEEVCKTFEHTLNLKYFFKPNSGPGPSRNFGCKNANGNYFIILDSDCIIPSHYIAEVKKVLNENILDAFGGPDAAHESFSSIQKGINYAMTSVFTTGGIRGASEAVGKFQPRSFNMGISREVFEKTGGFGRVHPGEDPDLTFRIWNAGYKTSLIKSAYVYHKRRIDWKKFSKQMFKFGVVRVFLNKWHKGSSKLTYWFPSVFILGLLFSSGISYWFPWFLIFYAIYFILIFVDSLIKNSSLKIAMYSLIAVCIQFFAYGRGFLLSQFKVGLLGNDPEKVFPSFFFKKEM